uniref:Uncharacterized protein n=1 Tax=Schistosoma haematobium TaxID=6185 RepID=A0A095ANI3_SCHHA
MKEISLLAKMPDERMIWICYVTHHSHENRPNLLAESGCMVPTTTEQPIHTDTLN